MGDQKWASDDAADDLLAGILDETATEAEAEEQRIQAEIEAKKQEEQLKKEEEKRRKRQEAEQRLSAEKERLQEVEKRRTQKMEALRREELIESGEWVPPEEEEEEQEPQQAQDQPPPEATQPPQQGVHPQGHHPHSQHQAPGAAAQYATGEQPVQEIPQKSGKGVMIALTLVILGVIGAGAVAFFVLPDGYEIDGTTYERASYSPSETTTTVVEIGFQALPEEEEEEAAPPSRPSPPPPAATGGGGSSSGSSGATSSDDDDDDDSPSIDLGGSDPFGSGH